jgi:hypothetical protein
MGKKRTKGKRKKVRVPVDVDIDVNVRTRVRQQPQRRERVRRINNRRRPNLREMRRGMGGLTAANLRQPSFFGNTAMLSNAAMAQINNQKYETERRLFAHEAELKAIQNAPARAQQQQAPQIAALQQQIAGLQEQQQQQNAMFQGQFQQYQKQVEAGARQFVGKVAQGVGELQGQVEDKAAEVSKLEDAQAAREGVEALSAPQIREEVARRLGVDKDRISHQFMTAHRAKVNALMADADSPAKGQLLGLLQRSRVFTQRKPKALPEQQPQPQPQPESDRVEEPAAVKTSEASPTEGTPRRLFDGTPDTSASNVIANPVANMTITKQDRARQEGERIRLTRNQLTREAQAQGKEEEFPRIFVRPHRGKQPARTPVSIFSPGAGGLSSASALFDSDTDEADE